MIFHQHFLLKKWEREEEEEEGEWIDVVRLEIEKQIELQGGAQRRRVFQEDIELEAMKRAFAISEKFERTTYEDFFRRIENVEDAIANGQIPNFGSDNENDDGKLGMKDDVFDLMDISSSPEEWSR